MGAELQMFDNDVFRLGDIIHGERIKRGFKSVSQFSDAIKAETGVIVSKDALKRIEAGTQEPKTTQYMAICICLGASFDSMLEECLSPEMRKKYLLAPGRTHKSVKRDMATGEITEANSYDAAKYYWIKRSLHRLDDNEQAIEEFEEQDKPHL